MTLPRWALLLAPACGWISNHALTVGFDGSAYHGWQADPTVSTVEGELQRAIHAAGLATWTTRVRAKHQGTESSRTDAKVHAARLVACLPLNDTRSRASNELCALLNGHLPPDIRVWSVARLPEPLQRFDARAHCSHREYEYLVPVSFVESLARDGGDGGFARDDALARLQAACSLFEGAREWHNFAHVPRVPAAKRAARRAFDALPFTRDRIRVAEGEQLAVLRTNASDGHATLEAWPAAVARRCRGDVYYARAHAVQVDRVPYYAISIAGSGFLYLQLRIMAGAAIAVASGRLELGIVRAAVRTRCAARLPVAPACGLVLRSAGFAFTSQLPGAPAIEVNEAALRTLHGGSSELTTVALEDDAASHRAHAFYERSILPAVVAGWSAIADDCAATRDARAWRGQLALLAGWDRLLDGCGEGAEDAREVALLREALRREGAAPDRAESRAQRARFAEAIRAGDRSDRLSSSYLFPRRFHATMLVERGLLPGRRSKRMLAALGKRILARSEGLSEHSTSHELLRALDRIAVSGELNGERNGD